ncbi:MAG: hypothetical protein BWY63_03770 [Chloroflexi bacterium ADurb.Bin360]|nr:MAG: hypothetical protein BWY63_03770 [Chloroflexi bacterium ADurb.Bin360]
MPPAQYSAHTRHHLTRAKGFSDIIIGAQFQTHDAIHLFHPRGKHQNRKIGLLGANTAGELQPINLGQLQVQNDQVGALLSSSIERLLAIVGNCHTITCLLQVAPQDTHNLYFIIYDKNSLAHCHHIWR